MEGEERRSDRVEPFFASTSAISIFHARVCVSFPSYIFVVFFFKFGRDADQQDEN